MGRTKKYKYPTYEVVDGKWKITNCYKTWNNMMKRCYNEKWLGNHPTYKGCSVCTEWHDYDIFYEWFQLHYREGFQLDKDILCQDNKAYGPSTCVFVPNYINQLLVKRDNDRGQYQLGVSFHKQNMNYIAHLNINGKSTHLGSFSDPMSAHKAYCEAKYTYIKEVALEALKIGDIDNRTYTALLNYKINER